MPARSIASATISFGLVSIPTKLYTTNESSGDIHFNMLHDADGGRLRQQYVCTKCNEIVDRDHTVKGYEHAKGQYVVLSTDEIKALDAVATQTIALEEFVPAEAVDPLFVEKSYYIGPDKGGERAYKLIRDAEDAHSKKPASEKARPTASKIAAEKAAIEKAARDAAAAAAAAAAPPQRPGAFSLRTGGPRPVVKPAPAPAAAPAPAPAAPAAKAAAPAKPAAKAAPTKPAAKAPAKAAAKAPAKAAAKAPSKGSASKPSAKGSSAKAGAKAAPKQPAKSAKAAPKKKK